MATLAKHRDELNKDFDNLGLKRAELDSETEDLQKGHAELGIAKAKMADVVAKEMALTFESFVRDMLKNPEPRPEDPATKTKTEPNKKEEEGGGWL